MKETVKLNITKKAIVCLIAAVCIFLTLADTAWSDEEADAARNIMSERQDVVVTVKVVMSQRMIMKGREMYKSENEVEAIATVIDPSGLAVLSFSNIDPDRIYKEMLKGADFGGEDTPKFSFESEIKDIKIIMSDGTDVPAEVVMKDRDLDLAFIGPKEKLSESVPAIDLSEDREADVFDNIVILTRLGKIAGRVPSISMHRVEAVITKPRTYYLIDQNAFSGKLGAPAFTLDGKLAGIMLLRLGNSKNSGLGLSNMFSGMGGLMLSVILPAEDIAEVAQQAINVQNGKEK